MATIGTSISLTDNITATLTNITNALNLINSAFYDVQGTAANGVDTSSFEAITSEINAATVSIQELADSVSNIPPVEIPSEPIKTPAPTEPVKVPVVPIWNSKSNIDIFDSTGLDRLSMEMNSLNLVIDDVATAQRRIGEQALQMEILPYNAVWDINTANQRVEELSQKLSSFQNQDITFIGADGIEHINVEYESMRQSMNNIVNVQEQMNQAMENGDISKLNAGYTQLNDVAEQMERRIRDSITAVQKMNSVQWTSPANIELFQGNGVERYKQEIQSANDMMNRLAAAQQGISQRAANTALFPANMVSDINGMNNRVAQLREQLEKLSGQRIDDIGAGKANAEIEALRGQLNQALQVQEELNSAMSSMDISAANAAYNRLNSIVDSTERDIRDNISAQNQFNSEIKNSVSGMDSLKNKILSMAAAYMTVQGGKKILDLSDTAAQTDARLSMIVDDSGSVEALREKIFLSAQRSGADFSAVSDNITKLGLMAGSAFSSNDELIAFAEQMNKQFTIGGSSIQESSNAMYQLTQAMAAGRLQGDEFRSIMENAPLLAQSIANAMGKTTGELREMSKEGLITSDVIKNALFLAADETNRRFEEMPQTFAQAAISIKNNALIAFQPVLDRLSDLANSKTFSQFVSNAVNVIAVVAGITVQIFNAVAQISQFISDNWDIIEPIVWGIVAALGAYTTALIVHNGILAVSAMWKGLMALKEAVHSAAVMMSAGVTFTATAAQHGFNAALLACPITWIILSIIALIVLFVLFTEQVVGSVWVLGAFFKNIGLLFANVGIAIWEVIKNIGLWFANLGLSIGTVIQNIGLWFANLGLGIWEVLKACADNVLTAFQNAWINIQIGFYSFTSTITSGIKDIIEWLNKIPGVDISTTSIDSSIRGYASKMAELEASKHDYEDIGEAWNKGFSTYEYKDVGDAWNANQINWSKVSEGFNTFDIFEEGWATEAYSAGSEIGAGIHDWIDNNLSMSALLGKLGLGSDEPPPDAESDIIPPLEEYIPVVNDIAANTASMSKSISTSEENLKYLRDMAERDAVNRFTTAEVKIDLTSNNTIQSPMDLDGVKSYFEDVITEALASTAEGVHV